MSNIGKIIRVNTLPPAGERETNVIYQVAAPGAATYTDYAVDANGDLKQHAGEIRNYKVYTAKLEISQIDGSFTLKSNILENTLGHIMWSKTGAGSYKGILAEGQFVENKTIVTTNLSFATINSSVVTLGYNFPSNFQINLFFNPSLDMEIPSGMIEIRVYN